MTKNLLVGCGRWEVRNRFINGSKEQVMAEPETTGDLVVRGLFFISVEHMWL